MVNDSIKVHLLDTNGGVLDVEAGTVFPINRSVADLRDLTKRNGTTTKTIVLADTKNNATLLGHLYDINAGQGNVFDINKKQRCNVVQNGVVILKDGFFRLLSVEKTQNNLTEDDKVVYQAQIMDGAADFFSIISGRFLSDLEVPNDGHTYTASNIVNSWTHTASDIYKYIVPWTNLVSVPIKVMHPGIYAKWYFDKIHEMAGYNYQWDDLTSNNVRFDRLICPFNGDLKEVSKVYREQNTIIVQEITTQDYLPDVPRFRPNNDWEQFALQPPLKYTQEIQDPNNEWSVPGPHGQMVPLTSIFAPDHWKIKTTYDIEVVVKNLESSNIYIPSSFLGPSNSVIAPAFGVNNVTNSTLSGRKNIIFSSAVSNFAEIIDIDVFGNDNLRSGLRLKSGFNAQYAPGETVIATAKETVEWGATNINTGSLLYMAFYPDNILVSSQFRRVSTGFPAKAQVIIRIKSIRSEIAPYIENGIPLNTKVDLNLFVPDKVKQSDFLKSICTMFNLYAEVDPLDQYKIVYKKRDKFYDEGNVVDLTQKKAREKPQTVTFLPDLTNKKTVLSYKFDSSDSASKAYSDQIKETYGQLEITYPNEHVRDIDRREIIFAPTLNAQTFYGANVPRFGDDPFNPKTTLRILQDGGNLPCGLWTVEDYPFSPTNQTGLTSYPYFGHFDRPDRPTYDINFGLPKYLLYDTTALTQNNLFWNNWARTISHIETGNMLTAWFWLTEADMAKIKLNDKISVGNKYYYIHKIIDYNAADFSPTKLELISVEKEVNLGISTNSTIRPFNSKDIISASTGNWGAITSGRDLKDSKIAQNKSARTMSENSSYRQDSTNSIVLGRNNMLTQNFSGVIIGNNQLANDPGFYVGDYRLTNEGVIFRGGLIIDGGLDQVMDYNKTTEADFIDSGLDTVRKWGGISNARVFIDAGKIS